MKKSSETSRGEGMSASEKKAAFSLASLFLLRMMGLFMVLPVFALYAEHLPGSTPALVGLAVGIYGLTQAALQMPFGWLSDRIGRKPVIIAGLVIFAVGSMIAALAHSIELIVFGRAIQGAGAIAATVMALAADLTREEHRLKTMAIIGMTIGLSFSLSLIVGPVINSWFGVPGIFWLTAILAVASIAVVQYVVPSPQQSRMHRDTQAVPTQFRDVLGDGQLLRLDFGVFALHLVLTSTFVVMPLELRDQGHLAPGQHWIVYLAVMIVAMTATVPFVMRAEKRRQIKQVFVGAIVVLAAALAMLAVESQTLVSLVIALVVYFTAFNILEATLPSLVAKTAPADKKGTAMGVYSSSQFFGAFCGGAAGGWLHGSVGIHGVFVFSLVVVTVWFALAASMRNPRYLSSQVLRLRDGLSEAEAKALATRLTTIRGVAEAVVIPEDGVAYLKVDGHALDRSALQQFTAALDAGAAHG